MPTSAEKLGFLRRPAAFGTRGTVHVIETHFAWVFLAGGRAYKLKKPLRHKDMDYRSLAARQRACQEEFRLNRRMAPHVYRRAVPLTRTDGRLAIGGKGEIVDWLVEMRRLPQAALLDHAIRRGTATEQDIDCVTRALRRFYAGAVAHPVSASRYLARLGREIRANEREIARYADRPTQLLARQVRRAQLQALEKLATVLGARGTRVVDGHGDLRAEHVYIGRPIQIIDSLEFDPRLRQLDPAEEVSLLALEMERLGSPELADYLIQRFRQGSPSDLPPELFCFYRSHRAATRAKLAAWHIGDPQFPDARPWITRTDSLLEDAYRYAERACGAAEPAPVRLSAPRRRPALQQGRERRAGNDAAYGLCEQWGHMQFR